MTEWVQERVGRDWLWEMGAEVRCHETGARCRYQPCTAAQDVDCCRECMMCAYPCKVAGRKKCRR